MQKSIRKRDGRRVKFDHTKIETAIEKAGLATGEFDRNQAEKLAKKVLAKLEQRQAKTVPNVEEIQDIVEDVLIDSKYKKTAKAYIIYRDQHQKIRDITSDAHIDLVDQYLGKLDWKIKENSNMGYSLQGLNNYVSAEVSKTYWLDKIYTPEMAAAHKAGDLHMHDLNPSPSPEPWAWEPSLATWAPALPWDPGALAWSAMWTTSCTLPSLAWC